MFKQRFWHGDCNRDWDPNTRQWRASWLDEHGIGPMEFSNIIVGVIFVVGSILAVFIIAHSGH